MARDLVIVAGLAFTLNATVGAETFAPTGFDSAAIAEAIDRAAPGDSVQLAAGVYELTEAVRPKSAIKLLGAGQERTRLVYRGQQRTSLVSLGNCSDLEVAHLTLDGEENPLVLQGISGSNCQRLRIHQVTVRNLANTGSWGPHGIIFSGKNPTMERGVTDSVISDCHIENIGLGAKYGGGIRLAWGSARNRVLHNVIHKTGRGGIFGDHSPELTIRHNRVTGSGGTGLGIEIWGGCPRSLVEDNVVDHWISLDRSDQSAVRRNRIGTDDGTLKGYGIEVIARDVVVTDNVVTSGARIGLSVSNKPVKNNVFWGYNQVRDCLEWGTQLQGETGGIAKHYFYRCTFENTVRAHPQSRYKTANGHGFRTNGACRQLALEECLFGNNQGLGIQLGGPEVDQFTFLRCRIIGNAAAMAAPADCSALELTDCIVQDNKRNTLPQPREFPTPAPTAAFESPEAIVAGQPARFRCASVTAKGQIVERLWDFNDGIPETTKAPTHVFPKAGNYRVTLIVWDNLGRGARAEETIKVVGTSSTDK